MYVCVYLHMYMHVLIVLNWTDDNWEVRGLGFRVQGVGLKVWRFRGFGFRVKGLGDRVYMVQGLGFGI